MSKKTFGDEGWSPSDKITGLLKLLLRDTFTNIRLILTFYFWDDKRQNKFQKSNKHFKQIIYLVVAVFLIWMVTRRWWAWSNRKPEKTDFNVFNVIKILYDDGDEKTGGGWNHGNLQTLSHPFQISRKDPSDWVSLSYKHAWSHCLCRQGSHERTCKIILLRVSHSHLLRTPITLSHCPLCIYAVQTSLSLETPGCFSMAAFSA